MFIKDCNFHRQLLVIEHGFEEIEILELLASTSEDIKSIDYSLFARHMQLANLFMHLRI